MSNRRLRKSATDFSAIRRDWSPSHKIFTAKITTGQFYVTRENEAIMTILGSCIAACIRDTSTGIGGMNHFMLPINRKTQWGNLENQTTLNAACYGDWAMEQLINEIIKQGGSRKHLEVKIFGGAHIIQGMTNIGEQNIKFVLDYIQNEKLLLAGQDLRGIYPRKIIYYPFSGLVRVKKLHAISSQQIISEEKQYLQRIYQHPPAGDTELFE